MNIRLGHIAVYIVGKITTLFWKSGDEQAFFTNRLTLTVIGNLSDGEKVMSAN